VIDLNTATMGDVIARSCAMHPTLFADAMRNARAVHTGFMHVTRDHAAFRAAQGMAKHLDAMEKALRRNGSIDPASLEMGARVQAFAIAARLQCIPRNVQDDITARS
jgi:hypothetical protein